MLWSITEWINTYHDKVWSTDTIKCVESNFQKKLEIAFEKSYFISNYSIKLHELNELKILIKIILYMALKLIKK